MLVLGIKANPTLLYSSIDYFCGRVEAPVFAWGVLPIIEGYVLPNDANCKTL
jgi:hypothetical protein